MCDKVMAYRDYLFRQIRVYNSILSQEDLTVVIRKRYEARLEVMIDAIEEFELTFKLLGSEVMDNE